MEFFNANPRAYIGGIGGFEQINAADMVDLLNRIDRKVDVAEERRQMGKESDEMIAAYNGRRRELSQDPLDILPPIPITDSRQVRAQVDPDENLRGQGVLITPQAGGTPQETAASAKVDGKQTTESTPSASRHIATSITAQSPRLDVVPNADIERKAQKATISTYPAATNLKQNIEGRSASEPPTTKPSPDSFFYPSTDLSASSLSTAIASLVSDTLRHVTDHNVGAETPIDTAVALSAASSPSALHESFSNRAALERSAQEWTTPKSKVFTSKGEFRLGRYRLFVMQYKDEIDLPR